jgi:hypothetical protein
LESRHRCCVEGVTKRLSGSSAVDRKPDHFECRWVSVSLCSAEWHKVTEGRLSAKNPGTAAEGAKKYAKAQNKMFRNSRKKSKRY